MLHKSFKPTMEYSLNFLIFALIISSKFAYIIFELVGISALSILWLIISGLSVVLYLPTLGWIWAIQNKYTDFMLLLSKHSQVIKWLNS